MNTAELDIPIPQYPPSKIRQSVTDVDPVRWVHVLEVYIKLMQLLISSDCPKLLVRSTQQLQGFIKLYLSETAQESSGKLSLGAVNPDILNKNCTLRACVWQVFKSYSLVKLNIDASCAWDIVRVYGELNCTNVRSLIDGSFVSPMNDNKKSGRISIIGPLQCQLVDFVESDRFSSADMTSLLRLLGQKIVNPPDATPAGPRIINKNIRLDLSFSEKFVDVAWIQAIEKIYAGGLGRAAPVAKDIMIVSLVLLRAPAILHLIQELEVYSVADFIKYPLMGTIILSNSFRQMVPSLEERVLFLSRVHGVNGPVNDADVVLLSEMFPHLLPEELIQELEDSGNNIQLATNTLLENGGIVKLRHREQINTKAQTVHVRNPRSGKQQNSFCQSKYHEDDLSHNNYQNAKITFGKKQMYLGPASLETKLRILALTLRLLYESDEDEPDDLYADQEKTSGTAGEDGTRPADKAEQIMFAEYKRGGEKLFEKKVRKLPERLALKNHIKLLDEQIEGWFRVLMRLPRRFKMLEEDYFFNGRNNVRRKNLNRLKRSGAFQGDEGCNISATSEEVHNQYSDSDDGAAGMPHSAQEYKQINLEGELHTMHEAKVGSFIRAGGDENSCRNTKATNRTSETKQKKKATLANHSRRQEHNKKNRQVTKGL